VDGHPQPPSPLVVSLGGPAPPAGFLFLGDGIAGTAYVPYVPAQQRDAIPLGERTKARRR
jgi:hypothetical protein